MSRYIDADALYEKAAELEASAFAYIEKLNKTPREEMLQATNALWQRWTAILGERSAFKHDVADAPTADVRENVRGRWIVDEDGNIECSVCGHHGVGDLYCERCGAKMGEAIVDEITKDEVE